MKQLLISRQTLIDLADSTDRAITAAINESMANDPVSDRLAFRAGADVVLDTLRHMAKVMEEKEKLMNKDVDNTNIN